jgi:tetratricopeptide (TPR) repeat protein
MKLPTASKALSPRQGCPLVRRLHSPPFLLFLFFLLGLGLRLLYLSDVHDLVVLRQLVVDAQAYDEWALALAAGDWVGKEVFYQDPLYPYLLAFFYALFGRQLLLVYTLQCVIGAAGVFPLYGFTRRSCDEPRIGLVAALLWAGYKVDFFFNVQIEKASLTLFLFMVLLWLLAVVKDRPHVLSASLAGLTAGSLFLLRGNFFLVVPVLFAWLAYRLLRRRSHPSPSEARPTRVAGPLAVMALACALVPAGALVRNRLVGGEWVLTTAQGGVNFFVGNYRENLWGVGKDPAWGRRTPVFERDDFLAEAKRRTGRDHLSWAEMDRFWYGEALREIAADYTGWLYRLGHKVLLIVNHQEIPDNLHYDFIRDYFSWTLKLPLPSFWIAGPFGFAGLGLALLKRKAGLPVLAVLSYFASLLAFYVVDRYRLPLVAPLLCLAAYGLVSLPGLVRARDTRSLALYLAASVVFAGLAYPRYFKSDYDVAWQKMGHSYSREGNWPEAIKCYEKSLALNPGWAQSWLGLGMAYEATRRFDEALPAYEKAVHFEPRFAGGHFLFAQALERAGFLDDALAHYKRALELDPSLSEAGQALKRLKGL